MDPEDEDQDDEDNPYEPTTGYDWMNPLAPDDADQDSVADDQEPDDDFGY